MNRRRTVAPPCRRPAMTATTLLIHAGFATGLVLALLTGVALS
ncbi:hypothetical protein [Jannaschia sp. W003]|nr:hypothetical protein [Jannaschia sp. W003]